MRTESDKKRVLLLLGGRWHDFAGFAGAVKEIMDPAGYVVDVTYDPRTLLHLDEKGIDLVISYTCFSELQKGTTLTGADKLNEAEVKALSGWVERGGGLLAAHAATVIGESDPGLRDLIGGEFVAHPEPFAFTVYPFYEEHPATAGIKAFTVYDEFYVEKYDLGVRLHLAAMDRGIIYPMAWSKTHGKGKVFHLAPGHDRNVWENSSYRRLILQSAAWLTWRSDKPAHKKTNR